VKIKFLLGLALFFIPQTGVTAGCEAFMAEFGAFATSPGNEKYTGTLISLMNHLDAEKHVLTEEDLEKFAGSGFDPDIFEAAVKRTSSIQYKSAMGAAIQRLKEARKNGAVADEGQLLAAIKRIKEKVRVGETHRREAEKGTKNIFLPVVRGNPAKAVSGLEIHKKRNGEFVIVTHDTQGMYLVHPDTGVHTKINDAWMQSTFYESGVGESYLVFNTENKEIKVVDTKTGNSVETLGIEEALGSFVSEKELSTQQAELFENDDGHLALMVLFATRIYVRDLVTKKSEIYPRINAGWTGIRAQAGKIWYGTIEGTEGRYYEFFNPSNPAVTVPKTNPASSSDLPIAPFIYRARGGGRVIAAWDGADISIYDFRDPQKTIVNKLGAHFIPRADRDMVVEGPQGEIYYLAQRPVNQDSLHVFAPGRPQDTLVLKDFPIARVMQAEFVHMSGGKSFLIVVSSYPSIEDKSVLTIVDWATKERFELSLDGLETPFFKGAYETATGEIYSYFRTNKGIEQVQLYGEAR
jgi:hypothetical protein